MSPRCVLGVFIHSINFSESFPNLSLSQRWQGACVSAVFLSSLITLLKQQRDKPKTQAYLIGEDFYLIFKSAFKNNHLFLY